MRQADASCCLVCGILPLARTWNGSRRAFTWMDGSRRAVYIWDLNPKGA